MVVVMAWDVTDWCCCCDEVLGWTAPADLCEPLRLCGCVCSYSGCCCRQRAVGVDGHAGTCVYQPVCGQVQAL